MKTEELKEEIEMFKETEDEHSCNYNVGDDYCQGCFNAGAKSLKEKIIKKILKHKDCITYHYEGEDGEEKFSCLDMVLKELGYKERK